MILLLQIIHLFYTCVMYIRLLSITSSQPATMLAPSHAHSWRLSWALFQTSPLSFLLKTSKPGKY